jgi:hypothetical protein
MVIEDIMLIKLNILLVYHNKKIYQISDRFFVYIIISYSYIFSNRHEEYELHVD